MSCFLKCLSLAIKSKASLFRTSWKNNRFTARIKWQKRRRGHTRRYVAAASAAAAAAVLLGDRCAARLALSY